MTHRIRGTVDTGSEDHWSLVTQDQGDNPIITPLLPIINNEEKSFSMKFNRLN